MTWSDGLSFGAPLALALLAWGIRTHYRLAEALREIAANRHAIEDLQRAHELHAKYLDSIGKRLSVIETNTEWIKQALLRLDAR